MEKVKKNKFYKLLDSKELIIKTQGEIIEILKNENKILQERIKELEE